MIDYAPFANLAMCETNRLTIERIQRKAIKIALNIPLQTSTDEIYSKVKLENIIDRSYKLTDKFLRKAMLTNQVIKSLVETYRSKCEHFEGSYCKGVPRLTILGLLTQMDNSIELNT